MKKDELFDYLDGFFAWDTGCVGSGIQDASARERVKQYLNSLSPDHELELLKEFVSTTYSDRNGYAEEDRTDFNEWYARGLSQ